MAGVVFAVVRKHLMKYPTVDIGLALRRCSASSGLPTDLDVIVMLRERRCHCLRLRLSGQAAAAVARPGTAQRAARYRGLKRRVGYRL